MTGLGGGAAGIDPERVAEVLVELDGHGPGRRGSGYRISAEAVLTAAHVVRDANAVRVRFDADRSGEWVAEGRVAWSDPGVDVAVVTITPRPDDSGRVEPVGFGRVAERDAVLECSAMGFPLFKLRDDPSPAGGGIPSRYRDAVHAVGTIAVLSNRREGTLEVSVAAPERDPDPKVSPWGGMSGAAVWSAGRVIGLIAEHHRSDGLGRLAATRVDRWHERLSPARLRQLRDLTGLPAELEDLREVVPPTGSELVEAGYLAQVRDLAPEELRGRERELAELVQFCAGDEPYLWWRAKAWAGKSALAAWFVVHPPAGVRVVSFFVTRRLAGQADSLAFTEAMAEQLAAVADEAISTTPSGRDRERILLLDLAARRVGERQERLLLVVDGLDEDEGSRPGSHMPSIASLLPRRPARNVRVLVTSRPHPGIPTDVPGDHPLRRCVPRPLEPSPFARHIELAATNELMQQFHGDELKEKILGYIAASGGGLTLADLAELTGSSRLHLDGMLGSVFGRSLMTLTQRGPPPAGPDDVVYLFAHEELSAVAQKKLGDDLRGYRQRVDGWADGYRARGWPAETPLYLLWPYGKLLGDEHHGDLHRLTDLATDPRRHDRLLAATLGDGDAIAELAAAQKLALQQAAPDLVTLGRLAVHRDRLESRNENLPVELPALLVRLGQRRRGEAMAKSMPPHRKPDALAAVAGALAEVGRWERAEEMARELADPGSKARALAWVGRAMVEADRERALGLLDEAGEAAVSVPESHLRPFVLAAVAEASADAGLWERAEAAARSIDPLYAAAGARALRSVVDALAAAGHWGRAEETASAVPGVWARAAALATVGAAMAGHDRDRAVALARHAEGIARGSLPVAGDPEPLSAVIQALAAIDRDRGLRLAADAEHAVRRVPLPAAQAHARGRVAMALASAGLWDDADRVAQSVTEPTVQADVARALSQTLARAGRMDRAVEAARGIPDPRVRSETLTLVAGTMLAADPGRALGLAADVEQTARGIPHAGKTWALQAVARAQAAAGQLELAERTARDLPHPEVALQAVAQAQAGAGLWDRAERTALDITVPDVQTRALAAVARAMQAAGQWDRAERAVRHITDQDHVAKAEALAELAEAVAAADPARAGTLAADAWQVAPEVAGDHDRSLAAGSAARALAAAGQWDDAEAVARQITDLNSRCRAIGAVARTMAGVDPSRAQALVLTLALAAEVERAGDELGRYQRDDAQPAFAEALAGVEEWEWAERVARGIIDGGTRAEALAALTQALTGAGELDRAERVAGGITQAKERALALAMVAGALVGVDPDRALAVTGQAEDAARTIPSLYERGKALATIVERLAAAIEPDPPGPGADDPLRRRVRRLLGEVLAGERWLDALEPLGRLDPDALAAVDRELHG